MYVLYFFSPTLGIIMSSLIKTIIGSKNARIPLGAPGFFLADLPAAPKELGEAQRIIALKKHSWLWKHLLALPHLKGGAAHQTPKK